MSTSETTRTPTLSDECTTAKHPDYTDMHGWCRQTEDVLLPHGKGLLLMARCGCACHSKEEAEPCPSSSG